MPMPCCVTCAAIIYGITLSMVLLITSACIMGASALLAVKCEDFPESAQELMCAEANEEKLRIVCIVAICVLLPFLIFQIMGLAGLCTSRPNLIVPSLIACAINTVFELIMIFVANYSLAISISQICASLLPIVSGFEVYKYMKRVERGEAGQSSRSRDEFVVPAGVNTQSAETSTVSG